MALYELPELPYDYSALEPHYSAEVLELHHDKHHKAYVDGANTTFEKLGRRPRFGRFRHHQPAREEHGVPPLGPRPPLALLEQHVARRRRRARGRAGRGGEGELRLATTPFRAQISEAANNVQGSGWAALSWEPLGSALIVEQIYDHQGNVGQGGPPLLALDMWEHAYYLQYKNVKKDWVEAFWNIVNWPDVADRFDRVKSLQLV